jgi:hypothetical protein
MLVGEERGRERKDGYRTGRGGGGRRRAAAAASVGERVRAGACALCAPAGSVCGVGRHTTGFGRFGDAHAPRRWAARLMFGPCYPIAVARQGLG